MMLLFILFPNFQTPEEPLGQPSTDWFKKERPLESVCPSVVGGGGTRASTRIGIGIGIGIGIVNSSRGVGGSTAW